MIWPWSVIQFRRFVPPWRDKGDACSAHGEYNNRKSSESTLLVFSTTLKNPGHPAGLEKKVVFFKFI